MLKSKSLFFAAFSVSTESPLISLTQMIISAYKDFNNLHKSNPRRRRMADGCVEEFCPLKKEEIRPLGDFSLPLNIGAPFARFDPGELKESRLSGRVSYPSSNIL